MRLNDPLITSFSYQGKLYDIDLSLGTVLDVFDYLDNQVLRQYEKAEICLALLLDDQEYEKSETINLWNFIYESFIHIEQEQAVQYDLEGNPMPAKSTGNGADLINLEQDAEHIYASFMQAYNINLMREQATMHWREFQALLNGLPSNTIMQRIIQIRAWKPSKGDSSEYKKQMEELQRIHAIKKIERR